MQVIKEFKSIKKFPVFLTVFLVAVLGYVDYWGVVAISGIFVLVAKAVSAEIALLMWVNIVMIIMLVFISIVLVWFNWVSIWGFAENIRLIGVSLNILDEGIEIRGRSKKAFVSNSSILHVFRSANKRALLIVWNGAKDIMTFVISNETFGKNAVDEADLILSKRRGYVDDPKQTVEICKGIKKFHRILLPFRSLCDIADGVEISQQSHL